jgi:hypothetical protein
MPFSGFHGVPIFVYYGAITNPIIYFMYKYRLLSTFPQLPLHLPRLFTYMVSGGLVTIASLLMPSQDSQTGNVVS